jgi:carbon monoxide dehydrogenase subunit G
MTLKEHVHIDRPPEDVWNVIENPETMKLWNPNVKHVVLYNWGARSQGFRYRMTYALSGKANELDAEMLEYRPPVRLVIKLTGGRFARKTCIHEIYDLVPVEGGTRLEQTIDIHDAGIPLLYRMLIWFIRRFGKPTGPSYLAGVKALVEGKQASGLST